MLAGKKLIGDKVVLRDILLSDCNNDYLKWMNDEETNKYMETRWMEQTDESIRNFVIEKIKSDDSILFAILDKTNSKHVGNIKIGPINSWNHFSDISYFLGDKTVWGKGLASDAISLACRYAFNDLGIHRLQAGVIEGNIASSRALEKNGFQIEGYLKDRSYLQGKGYVKVSLYSLLSNC